MKFAQNLATDTLPHKSNLSLWRGLNDSCKLCGEKQTLSHVFKHCEVALKLCCYNHCHDEVLSVIATSHHNFHPPIPDDIIYHLIVPLPELHCGHGPETQHSDVMKEVVLAELTICYETKYVRLENRSHEVPLACIFRGGRGG